MSEKSEALELADFLETSLAAGIKLSNECAAMLRKLVAENELLHERHSFDNGVVKELMEVLETMIENGQDYTVTRDKARAVIAKVRDS
jgi:hypothetical protein